MNSVKNKVFLRAMLIFNNLLFFVQATIGISKMKYRITLIKYTNDKRPRLPKFTIEL